MNVNSLGFIQDKPYNLTEQQKRAYQSKGWALLPALFTKEETAMLCAWVDELIGRPEEKGGVMLYRETSLHSPEEKVVQRIEDFSHRHDGFRHLLATERLSRLTSWALGGESCLFKDKINFKMPGGAGFELHQDQQAGWSVYAPLFVSLMISLDPATPDNGCLEMADMPKLSSLLAPEWEPVKEDARYNLIPLTTHPGDAVVFDSYALHASKANMTESSRRIIYLTYNLREQGDHRIQYFADKRASFPPDIERLSGKEYVFKV